MPQSANVLKSTVIPGYRHGLAQPCIQLVCELLPCEASNANTEIPPELSRQLAPMQARYRLRQGHAFPAMPVQESADCLQALEPLNTLLVRLQLSAGWPLSSGGTVLGWVDHPKPGNAVPRRLALLACAAFEPRRLSKVLPWVLDTLGWRPSDDTREKTSASFQTILQSLTQAAPTGTNTRLLLQAAYERNIPVIRISDRIFQYGWGARSRWMNSTFTEQDSAMAASLARNKPMAHALMQRAGLPVPAQRPAPDKTTACQAAAEMGYPVVLKPADLDGGAGVSAGITDEITLGQAFQRAAAFGRPLIIEKHIEGKDYRIGIIHGRLGWVTHREPAGVWGNGVSTVLELVTQANLDPRRSTQPWSQMSPITLNDEAHELLHAQGLNHNSVVADGVFAPLRRASNISLGGRPSDCTDHVHPDNVALAVQAARTFRLQMAGVDLIMPDITRSWREVGGAICEINGQPQFAGTRPECPGQVMDALVVHQGRIPIVFVLLACLRDLSGMDIQAELQDAGLNIGLVAADGVFVGSEYMQARTSTSMAAIEGLLLDRRVEAVVVACECLDLQNAGLPVDHVDLVIADNQTRPELLRLFREDARCQIQQSPAATSGKRPFSWTPTVTSFLRAQAAKN